MVAFKSIINGSFIKISKKRYIKYIYTHQYAISDMEYGDAVLFYLTQYFS